MAFLYPVTAPVKQWYDRDGSPLEGGKIYFGIANQNPETNPITMYWDAAGTIQAAQPLRTSGGFIVRPGPGGTPANVFATGDFSVTVRDENDVLVFTLPNSTDIMLALAVTGASTAAAIPIADAGGYYTTDNVEAALQQVAAPGFMSLAKLAGTDVLPFLVPTGAILPYCATTAPTGWVLASGRTIGSAASGGTERANADTSALYTLLWNNYGNTELPIQDSAGTPTTRGASAANDFAANKRLPVPDYRGRVGAGKDDMGGSTASRLTAASGVVGTTMGETGGTETHTLVTGEMPAHTHTQDAHTHTQNSHNHTQDAHTHTQNSHNHTQDAHNHTQNPHQHTTDNDFANGSGFTGITGGGAGNVVTYTFVTSTANATVATNQAATATNQAATATNQNTIATNQAATATNQNATATNQNTGGGGAHQNTQPTIIEVRIIKL